MCPEFGLLLGQAGYGTPPMFSGYPQMLMSPVLVSIIWNAVFADHEALDSDRLIEAHVEMLLRSIAVDGDVS